MPIVTALGRAARSARPAPAQLAAGSIYIVKPKMHGPEEVAFAVDALRRVEELLGLPTDTIKIGIMDEERRTTRQPAGVHPRGEGPGRRSSTPASSTAPATRSTPRCTRARWCRKGDMKNAAFLAAYEDRNVDIGLAAGFRGRAQIGKGMWAMPDLMPTCSSRRSPTPRPARPRPGCRRRPRRRCTRCTITRSMSRGAGEDRAAARDSGSTTPEIPLAGDATWSRDEIVEELDNNVQSILGYVVRWIDQGIGCSKVPDIHDIGLMEDRATLRISSQLLANWLAPRRGRPRPRSMRASTRMAPVVDAQNAGDPLYEPLSDRTAPASPSGRSPADRRGRRAAQRLHGADPARHPTAEESGTRAVRRTGAVISA